jgi:hypothetical protein
MDEFWRAFEQAAPQLDAAIKGEVEFDISRFMGEHLGYVERDLRWGFDQGVAGHCLFIMARGGRQLHPMIDVSLSRAPKLEGWEYGAYVPPILARAVHRHPGLAEKVRAAATAGDGGLVDVTLFFDDERDAMEAARWRVEYTLGEEPLDKWIGAIEAKRNRPFDFRKPVRLTELPAAVDSLRRAWLKARPPVPWHAGSERKYAVLTADPVEALDYGRHDDLLTAVTADTEWWRSAHGKTGYSSERFSRFGEKFAFVKIDRLEGRPSKFRDRTQIQEALDAVLTREKLGGVVGGAYGLRYSYVDVALNDLAGGVAKIQHVLQAGAISRRSWILFFDPELADEWVGIYDDTPPPPGVVTTN